MKLDLFLLKLIKPNLPISLLVQSVTHVHVQRVHNCTMAENRSKSTGVTNSVSDQHPPFPSPQG